MPGKPGIPIIRIRLFSENKNEHDDVNESFIENKKNSVKSYEKW